MVVGIETRISTLDSSTSESLNEVDKRITKLDKEGGEAFLAMWSKKRELMVSLRGWDCRRKRQ